MNSDPEKTNYWRQHVEAVKSSGLTRKAYCEANQIKKSSFDYWCHKLSYLKRKANGKETGWIPVQVCEDTSSGIELRIRRMTIAIKPGFDQALLNELLRAIGALC
jgi:hypothetical protein